MKTIEEILQEATEDNYDFVGGVLFYENLKTNDAAYKVVLDKKYMDTPELEGVPALVMIAGELVEDYLESDLH